ncbi:DUF2487 family protein [Gracilibacillus alcaliphilus]|uniref:DUF2487 family protein n=1 Tax=Gracilibacillus alcaliphilus TaxID=1401441 RepID=UPI00195C222F|nr:DUF2487 family protein [Gracilibacillus alcaliphilus]MBM7675200.1 hypothetical protein [Gracilibacillus alcaliphilus]
MQWKKKDLQLFFQSKSYIDTLIIPVIPIELASEASAAKLADQKRSIQIISDELERQFMGRLFLSPNYSYIYNQDYQQGIELLNQWTSTLSNEHFNHIFFLTHDVNWKKHESQLNGQLIWLPTTTIDDFQSDYAKQWVGDQVNQVSELISSYWKA